MSTQDHEPEMPEGEEPPPAGTRAMAIVRWTMLGAMAILAVFAWATFARSELAKSESAERSKVRYRCPMHPQIVSDTPGECPICHMTLEPIPAEPPKSDAGAPLADGSARHAGHAAQGNAPADAGATPAGVTPIQLSFDRVQAIGVRTSVAALREMKHTTRVTAIVEAPEQGASEVHVRTPGFVETLVVNQTGIAVGAGQTLFLFYGPAIFEAEQELVAARRWSDAGDPTSNAARTKLGLLGVQTSEIDDVERTGVAKRAVAVVAPKAGYVVKKGVTLGSYVTPDMVLYSVQDLSRVFVIANVFQGDLGAATVGTAGTFRPNRTPDRAIAGRVDLVYPSVSADARTTRVRMQVDNPDRRLLPGEYGIVELASQQHTMTMVPRDAVIDTGTQTYVFVDDGGGRFTPRTVVLGREEGDQIAIEAGVTAGERVVSGATFLIDSESRLQASISTQITGPPAAGSCDADFDKGKYPGKWSECRKCEQVHAGMGGMVTDCKNAIAKPWR